MRRGAVALWRTVLGLSVLALMLVGCDATPQSAAPTHGRALATATATPTKMLDWREVSLPPGVPATEDTPNGALPIAPVVSHVNGRNAWVCAPASGASFQVWFTQDAGATWRKMGTLTPTAPLPITTCDLITDQGDADALVAIFDWSSGNGPSVSSGSITYYSTDDGVNWLQMPRNILISQVVTVGATTYATLLDTSTQISHLVASTDHLASWRVIQIPTQSANGYSVFWAAAAPGGLLWGLMNTDLLYLSNSGGSWTAIPSPASAPVQVNLAAWRGQPGGWLVCGYVNIAAGTPEVTAQTECSADLGKTWVVYPTLKETWECGHCAADAGPSSGVHPCLPSAITASGALYSVCGNDPQDSGTPPTPWTISRLSPGASAWTTLGLTSCQSVTFTQTGQAWCFDDLVSRSTYMLDQLP
jgi:hypothetical protein